MERVAQLRPAGVPLAATFYDDSKEWAYGPFDQEGYRQGSWRFYSDTGALGRIVHYAHGVLHGAARRYELADVVEEVSYVLGAPDGVYWRRISPEIYRATAVLDGEAGGYAAPLMEIGTFDRGVRVGTVRVVDGHGRELVRFQFGDSPLTDDMLKAGVLSIFPRSPAAWLEFGESAFDEGRIDEGILALARAVGTGAQPDLLKRALEVHALPVSLEEGIHRAHRMVGETSPRLLLAALLAGAEPVDILSRLSTVLAGSVALDLVEAAIAIAEDPLPLVFSRAVLRVLSGDVEGARRDARVLRFVRPEEHALLVEAIDALETTGPARRVA